MQLQEKFSEASAQITQAVGEMSESIGGNPKYWRLYYELALMQLDSGDIGGYRKMCGTLREAASQIENPAAASFAAWTGALAPDAVDDYAPIIGLARGAVDAKPENHQYLKTFGAILLRAGQVEEAIAKLTAAEQREASNDSQAGSSTAYTQYFLAMAHHAAGNSDQAGQFLQAANTGADGELQGQPAWNRRMTLQLLRAEATALLPREDDSQIGSESTKSDPVK